MGRQMPILASAGLAATALVAAGVARLELASPGSTVVSAALAAAVVFAYPLAAVMAGGPRLQRALFGSVGLAWALPSWWTITGLVHQSVLAVALLAFPDGRLHGLARWLVAGAAVPLHCCGSPNSGLRACS